jgi:hypothetical protein
MKVKRFRPMVYWFYGKTGDGKSSKAAKWFPSAYMKGSNMQWWNGYGADIPSTDYVIFDDYRATWSAFDYMLKVCDLYRMPVETKGGIVCLNAKVIIITTPKNVEQTFRTFDKELRMYKQLEDIQ